MGTITIYIMLKLGINIKYSTQYYAGSIFIETKKSEAFLDLALKKYIKIIKLYYLAISH